MFKLPDGSLRLIVQGLTRAAPRSNCCSHPSVPPWRGVAGRRRPPRDDQLEIDALEAQHQEQLPAGGVAVTAPVRRPAGARRQHHRAGKLADFIASSLTTIGTAVSRKCSIRLTSARVWTRSTASLIKELEVLELGSKIQSQVQSEVGKNQREYFLARADEGDSEGTRRGRRAGQGDRRAAREARCGGHARACQEGSALRTRSPVEDAGRGGGIHRLPHLPRLDHRAPMGQADRRRHRPQADEGRARCGSLGPREGQGPGPRVPGRAAS